MFDLRHCFSLLRHKLPDLCLENPLVKFPPFSIAWEPCGWCMLAVVLVIWPHYDAVLSLSVILKSPLSDLSLLMTWSCKHCCDLTCFTNEGFAYGMQSHISYAITNSFSFNLISVKNRGNHECLCFSYKQTKRTNTICSTTSSLYNFWHPT